MTTPYPYFSTIWSGWMDSRNRGVTVLMAAGSKAKWIASRDNGQGMYGDGYGFNPMIQPNVPGVPTSGKLGPGAQRAAAFRGKRQEGGGASQTPQNNSGDGSTNSPNGSSNPEERRDCCGRPGSQGRAVSASPTDDEIQQLFDATEDDELAKHLHPPRTKEDLSIRKTPLGDVLEYAKMIGYAEEMARILRLCRGYDYALTCNLLVAGLTMERSVVGGP
ncbi:hypothetical protein MTO96_027311 [Rhipicephalus appendiculatus]